MLIVLCGLPSTGKTTAARYLAVSARATILATDEVRRQLFKRCDMQELLTAADPMKCDIQRLFDPLPNIPEKYQQMIWKQNAMVYEEILRRIPALLSEGNGVLDGSFSSKSTRQRAYSVSMSMGHRPYLVHCVCPEPIVRRRLERRPLITDEPSNVVTMYVYNKVKERFQPPSSEGVTVFTYDSDSNLVSIEDAHLGERAEIAAIERGLSSIVV